MNGSDVKGRANLTLAFLASLVPLNEDSVCPACQRISSTKFFRSLVHA